MLPSVHFVVSMSSPDFHARLDDVLGLAGVNLSLRHQYFPATSNAQHRTDASGTLRARCTRRTARRALQLYRADYQAFGLPVPGWLGKVNLSQTQFLAS